MGEILTVVGGVAASSFAIVRMNMVHQQRLLERFLSTLEDSLTRQEQSLLRTEEAIRSLNEAVREANAVRSRTP